MYLEHQYSEVRAVVLIVEECCSYDDFFPIGEEIDGWSQLFFLEHLLIIQAVIVHVAFWVV